MYNKYNQNEKMNLLKYVAYNNHEKLNENKLHIPKKFRSLLVSSVKYHSKECFDVIIDNDMIVSFLNKSPYSITCVFENFTLAPNDSNKYYVDKILPLLSVITSGSMNCIVNNLYLFQNIFNKLEKNEHMFIHLFDIICHNDSIISYKYLYNHIVSNNYGFFNADWINRHILIPCLVADSINILKELDNNNINIKSIIVSENKSISTLIISLASVYHFNKKNVDCFDYLLTKNNNIEQNLLWIFAIRPFYSCDKEYFKLDVQNIDDANDYIPDHISKLNDMGDFTDVNLRNIIMEYFMEVEYDSYHTNEMIKLLHTIILKAHNNMVKDLLQKTITIPDVNIIEKITKNIFDNIESLTNMRKQYRRRRALILIKRKIKKINTAINVIKYFKTNYCDNIVYNPLQELNININSTQKKLVKQTIMEFIDMKFSISNEFKTNVLEKLFTKNQVKKIIPII
jgi:hypothetical protein